MNLRASSTALIALASLALTGCAGAAASSEQLSTAETCAEIEAVLLKHDTDWGSAESDLRELADQASVATRDGILQGIDSAGRTVDDLIAACPE